MLSFPPFFLFPENVTHSIPIQKHSYSFVPSPTFHQLILTQSRVLFSENLDVVWASLPSKLTAWMQLFEVYSQRYTPRDRRPSTAACRSLLGDGDKGTEIRWGKKYFVLGQLEQPRQNKNLLDWHDKPNEPAKTRPLLFVLYESPFTSSQQSARATHRQCLCIQSILVCCPLRIAHQNMCLNFELFSCSLCSQTRKTREMCRQA